MELSNTAQALNAQLSAEYQAALSEWPLIANRSELSKPQLMMIPDAYLESKIKLMIVGQETAGWGSEACDPSTAEGIATLMTGYSEWDLALHTRYRATPFWQASYAMQRALNPGAPQDGFLWSNVVPVSQRLTETTFGRPTPEISRQSASWGLLRREIEVARPRVVIFFTGPSRDDLLRMMFPQMSLVRLTPEISEVNNLPRSTIAFRTYHPRYLRMRKRWSVLDEIVDLVGSAIKGAVD
jgi:hypothetical protein